MGASHTVNLRERATAVKTMDTRAGAGSVVLGAVAGGMQHVAVVAPSAALPHMIPALHQLARRGAPVVLHVAAAAVSPADLSLTPDLSDVLAARHTGLAMLLSFDGQEAQDMALVAHHAGVPVLHAYDALQTGQTEAAVRKLDRLQLGTAFAAANCDAAACAAAACAPTAGAAARLDASMEALAGVLGRRYRLFEYSGPADASIVVVVLGHGAPVVQQVVQQLNRHAQHVHKIGVLTIRAYRPWSAAHFLAALPRTTLLISVSDCTRPAAGAQGGLGEAPSPLFADVAASFHTGLWAGTKPVLVSNTMRGDQDGLTAAGVRAALDALVHSDSAHDLNLDDQTAHGAAQLSVWGSDAATTTLAAATAQALRDQGFVTKTHASTDHLAGAHDATRVRLLVAETDSALAVRARPADAVVVYDAAVFAQHYRDVIAELAPGGQLVLCFDPSSHGAATVPRGVRVAVADVHDVATQAAASLGVAPAAAARAARHIVALTAADRCFPFAVGADGVRARHVRGLDAALDALDAEVLDGFIALVQGSLMDVVLGGDDAPAAGAGSRAFRPRVRVSEAAVTPLSAAHAASPDHAAEPADTAAMPLHRVCWKLMFPEAYGSEAGLRPGQPGIYKVKLTKNKRLTPLDYDRNVFHLEFDITGSGLKYEIGDALGVYAHNDAAEVDEFVEFYGLDRHAFVALEAGPGGRQREVLSVQQLLEQRLDLFGKPGKKFYAALAGYALDPYEQKRLKWLGSEDKEGFRLRQLETVTFADILREFPSAHPPLGALVELIPPIKPRHYSIASSMKMCPNSVHLLVVQVAWTTPKGRKRFGQATRYLAGLRPEHYDVYVTVDVKPSVMRLPADPRAPVIMAGLGTGMAPFRAFLQERAVLRAQGIPVGPMTLYFGARHRATEFLYGDELERYEADGLVTLRCAFSRDQRQKIYIQDRLRADGARLAQEMHHAQGAFYLCGPTWPVPDVRAALETALVEHANLTPAQAADAIHHWKDTSRYILEVY